MNIRPTYALLSLLLAAPCAIAQQDASDWGMEEVIVTAQKRQENLQDVAIAVSAFSSDTIKNAGALNMQDITAMTPDFSVSNYNPTTPAP